MVIGSVISFLGLLATGVGAWVNINRKAAAQKELIKNLKEDNTKQDEDRIRFEKKIEDKFDEFGAAINKVENIAIRTEVVAKRLERKEEKTT